MIRARDGRRQAAIEGYVKPFGGLSPANRQFWRPPKAELSIRSIHFDLRAGRGLQGRYAV
jgi:hypothetical protein